MQAQKIYRYIERLGNLLRNDARRSVAEYGLQPIQLEVLHYLSICNRYSDTPKAATEYLGQTKGTVSQTLKVLENKGFLKKKTDNKDKRVTHLKLSSRARELLQACVPSKLFKSSAEQMSPALQTEILDSLQQLLSNLQHANSLKTFGVCYSCKYNQKIDENSYLCGLTREPLSGAEVQLICREHKAAA